MKKAEKAEVVQTLRRAARLVEKPGGWMQGRYACAADGSYASERDPEAVCFCASGAIIAASPLGDNVMYLSEHAFGRHLKRKYRRGSIVGWNDDLGRTQAEVVTELNLAADRIERPVMARIDALLGRPARAA